MNRNPQRVVLVTGASSGIGKICAEHLHRYGYRVYGTSRLAATCSEFPSRGVRMIAMDITSDVSVQQAVQLVVAREGRIDVVFNNAGYGIAGSVEDTSIEEAWTQLDANFFGTLRVCHAVLPILCRQGAGYLINAISISGLISIPFEGHYSVSKLAVEGLTEALRTELRSHGVRVALIKPGKLRSGSIDVAQQPVSPIRQLNAVLGMLDTDEQDGEMPDAMPDAIGPLLERIINTRDPKPRYSVAPYKEIREGLYFVG